MNLNLGRRINMIDISKIKDDEKRLNHYIALGFTEKALDDEDLYIRLQAKKIFEIQNKYKDN